MVLHNEVGTREDLAFYRLELTQNDLKSAQTLLEIGDYRGANNRAYYSIYHMISAIHALDGKAYKKHKDALANFNKDYIKTEIFPKFYGRKIAEAEEIRHASDYNDFYVATKNETVDLIETGKELSGLIKEYCDNYKNRSK